MFGLNHFCKCIGLVAEMTTLLGDPKDVLKLGEGKEKKNFHHFLAHLFPHFGEWLSILHPIQVKLPAVIFPACLSLSSTPPRNLTNILLSSLSLNYNLNLTGFPFLMRQSYACSLPFLPGPLQRTSGKCLPLPLLLNSEDRLLCSS